MSISLFFIRTFFTCICALFSIAYATTILGDGVTLLNVLIGTVAGLGIAGVLMMVEVGLRSLSLRTVTTSLLGMFLGYLLGASVLFLFDVGLSLASLPIHTDAIRFSKIILLLSCLYFGMTLTGRAAEEFYVSIPFVRLRDSGIKKKDMLLDWTILMESRIIELAASGLLDERLIVPQFLLKELYVFLESSDETLRHKAGRCLEVFKKLELLPLLNMRYSSTDFPELKDPAAKLVYMARILDAQILTGDAARLQPYLIEGLRVVNIHMLANALKPITGEQLTIKIQRYGKEARQGVGYLEDGTMVVVNGGAEFIGDTIKAHVLSVKHTATGRMIFCNAAEEMLSFEQISHHNIGDLDLLSKSRSTL